VPKAFDDVPETGASPETRYEVHRMQPETAAPDSIDYSVATVARLLAVDGGLSLRASG
jgi:hypothetical protein